MEEEKDSRGRGHFIADFSSNMTGFYALFINDEIALLYYIFWLL